MVSKKQYAILFLICFLAFSFYFVRPDLVGTDTYFFLQGVCFKGDLGQESALTKLIFTNLPCNFTLLKGVLFLLLLSSTIIVAHTGELFNKDRGWLLGVFVFLSPAWQRNFYYLENDQFAFPILFLALYLFLYGTLNKNFHAKLLSIVFVGLAALIWGGAIFYLIGFSLTFLFALLFVMPVMARNAEGLFHIFMPNTNISENWAYFAFLEIFILGLGILFLPLEIVPLTAWLILLVAVNSKFVILLIPLVGLGFLRLVNDWNPDSRFFFIIFAFTFAFGTALFSSAIHPTVSDWEAIDYGIEMSQDLNKRLINNWGYGYWVEWAGGIPSAKGSPRPQSYHGAVVMEYTDLNMVKWKCAEIKNFGELGVFDCE